MITTSKIKGFLVTNGLRIFKVLRHGVVTANECSSFGDDSNPLNNMIAIYADTEANGDSVIIGYIQKNRICKPGEKRIFSLNVDGSPLKHVYLRTDGIIEVGGDVDNLVKYEKLKEAIDKLTQDINIELDKIQLGISGVGGTYTPEEIQIQMEESKCEDLRCN